MITKLTNQHWIASLFIVLLSLAPLFAPAQQRRPMHPQRAQMNQNQQPQQRFNRMVQVLNLTEEQQEQMQTIRQKGWSKNQPLRNKMQIHRAELQAMIQSDKPNQKTIKKKIEEMGELRTQIHKNRVAHQLEMRSILTDEQRITFDQLHQNRNKRFKNR
ncbi:MAG: Spy/CpxP family protein refolding chaperone [Bacteroidota bacterium]